MLGSTAFIHTYRQPIYLHSQKLVINIFYTITHIGSIVNMISKGNPNINLLVLTNDVNYSSNILLVLFIFHYGFEIFKNCITLRIYIKHDPTIITIAERNGTNIF